MGYYGRYTRPPLARPNSGQLLCVFDWRKGILGVPPFLPEALLPRPPVSTTTMRVVSDELGQWDMDTRLANWPVQAPLYVTTKNWVVVLQRWHQKGIDPTEAHPVILSLCWQLERTICLTGLSLSPTITQSSSMGGDIASIRLIPRISTGSTDRGAESPRACPGSSTLFMAISVSATSVFDASIHGFDNPFSGWHTSSLPCWARWARWIC